MFLPCLNILQSVLKRHTVMSHKVNARNSKSRKFPRDSSYLNEKILSLKQSRKGYCSRLTKVIKSINKVNQVNQVIFENENTEALKVYEYQLDNFLHEIRAITTELHDLETDESKRGKIINFCTDQALRVVSIKDSNMNFYISNWKEREVKYFQNYQVNLLDHMTHLNLLAIEKAS